MNDKEKEQPKIHEVKRKSWDIISPLLLIGIGVVVLFNNFGIISWDIWEVLWRFWPIFIIILGLQLIFGKTGLGRFMVTLIGILLIALAFALSIASVNPDYQKWLYRELPIIQQFRFPSYSYDSFNNSILKSPTVRSRDGVFPAAF